MTLASDLVADTKRHLLSNTREVMNKLDGAINASAADVTLAFTSGLPTAGSYIEVDLEMMYVWSVAGQVATVERGQLGSTATTHDDAALVTINPRYPAFAVFKALNDDIRSLSAPANGMFAVRTLDLVADGATGWYDLTGATDVLDVLSVRHEVFGTDQWVNLTNWEISNVAGAGFASGSALRITDGLALGRTIRVLYKASFDPLVTLADDVESVTGMPEGTHDIPSLGAAMRLVAPREIDRNDTKSQGDSRRAEEVGAGAMLSSIRGIAGLRQTRINDEVSRLMQLHPDRGFIPAPSPSSMYAARW